MAGEVSKFKVLVLDDIAPEGLAILEANPRLECVVRSGLGPDEVKREIGSAHGVIVRSATRLTADVLEAARELRAVVRAGAGVDNIDVAAASKRGVVVMNTPGGNTVSTAEHTVAMIMALARNIPQASAALKAGLWDRKRYTGTEVRGKTLGIVGLGRVGRTVARIVEGAGMKVLGYDPFFEPGEGERSRIAVADGLDEVLAASDFITVHVPFNDDTRGMIGREELARTKPGVRIVNCARGGIVDEEALAEAIKSGHVAGAALDVFVKEPPVYRELVELDEVIVTPHLGASTEEAQVYVSTSAAEQLIDCLVNGAVHFAINMPELDAETVERLGPYLELAWSLGKLAGALAAGRARRLEAVYSGEAAAIDRRPVTTALVAGFLSDVSEEGVNMVNAPVVAAEHDLAVVESVSSASGDYSAAVSVKLATDKAEFGATGTVYGVGEPRIVLLDGFEVEAIPRGVVLVTYNEDRPGLIGMMGTILGRGGVNIARMTFGRKAQGGEAMMVLNLDAEPSAEVLAEVAAIENVKRLKLVRVESRARLV